MTTPPPTDGPAPVPSPPFAPVGSGPIPVQSAVPQTGYTAPPPAYGPPPGLYPPQPPVAPSGHRLAEFSDRLLARLIDGAILFVVSAIFIVPLYIVAAIWLIGRLPTETRVNGQIVGPEGDLPGFFLGLLCLVGVVMLLTFAINYVYDVELMYRSGQTVGKRVMKIRVQPVDPSQALTRRMALKRYGVIMATGFVPGLGWVDGLWQLWDKPWRQCLHDKFAQTLVIKLDP